MNEVLATVDFEKMIEKVDLNSLMQEKLGISSVDSKQSLVTLRMGESKKLEDGTIVTFMNPGVYNCITRYDNPIDIVDNKSHICYCYTPMLKFEYLNGEFDYVQLNEHRYLELMNAYAIVTNQAYGVNNMQYRIFAAVEYESPLSNGKTRIITVKRHYKTTTIDFKRLKLMKEWHCPEYQAIIDFTNQNDITSIKTDVVNKFDIGSFEIYLKDGDMDYIFLPKKVRTQKDLPLDPKNTLYFKGNDTTIMTAMENGSIASDMYTQYGHVNTMSIKASNRVKNLYKED